MGVNMVKVNLIKLRDNNYVRLSKTATEHISNLVRKTGLVLDKDSKENIYRMIKGKKISVRFLKKLKRILDLPQRYIQDNILLITSVKNTDVGIRNPIMPFNFNTIDGIRFIASIFGDGELNSQIQVRYNNQSLELVNIVSKSAKNIFGDIDKKVYYRKDKTYQLHLPKIVGLIVKCLGIRHGGKVATDNSIPSFIFQTNNKLKAVFIRQFFNDEGNVRLKDRRLQVKQTVINKTNSKKKMKSDPKSYCPIILCDLKVLLAELGIYSYISLGAIRNNKSDWELSIYGKENLERFQEYIGFDLDYKNLLLEKCLMSYKYPSAPRNRRIPFALEKCKKTQDRYGYITKHNLATESKRSLKTATYYIVDLNKKGLIKMIERGKYKIII